MGGTKKLATPDATDKNGDAVTIQLTTITAGAPMAPLTLPATPGTYNELERAALLVTDGLQVAVLCNAGGRPDKPNEDIAVVYPAGERKGFVVGDGIGGAYGGRVSAAILAHLILEDAFGLGTDFETVQTRAYEQIKDSGITEQGGVCYVACTLDDGQLNVYQAGDCRLIVARGGEVVFSSRDQDDTVQV